MVQESQEPSVGPDSSPLTQVRLLAQKPQPGVSMQVPQPDAASLFENTIITK